MLYTRVLMRHVSTMCSFLDIIAASIPTFYVFVALPGLFLFVSPPPTPPLLFLSLTHPS